jgi:endonuclease-8
MPEGPEIRRAADRLAAAVVGEPLVSAFFSFPKLKPFEAQLRGHRIVSILPHGKALLTRFDHGWTMYSHNQLYGVWQVAAAGERQATTRSLRVALETEAHAILLYSASEVSMWRDDDLHAHPFLSRLGPDVLDASLTAATVARRLQEKRFAGRALSALLLDQEFLAGMGNYLRSEVLFEAALMPQRAPGELSTAERKRLAVALLEVPRRSYATRGILPSTGMSADYLTDTPEGFSFKVFDRQGLACPRCGKRIVRRELGGRRLYLCNGCQR